MRILILEPLKLKIDKSYHLNVFKEITVTDHFSRLDTNTRKVSGIYFMLVVCKQAENGSQSRSSENGKNCSDT